MFTLFWENGVLHMVWCVKKEWVAKVIFCGVGGKGWDENVGTRRVLYNFSKVFMITKYWRTIGHTNICSSVHDHGIYPSSI